MAKARERTSAQRQPIETEIKLTFPPEAENRLAIPLSSLEAQTRPDQNGSSAPILIRLADLLDAA